jgi:hypothetical protein
VVFLFLTLFMTNQEVILILRISTKCSWGNLVKFLKRNLTFIRLYLNRPKGEKSMVITHEQVVLTIFLGLDSSALILVNFSWILELWIINYALIINFQRLILNL